MSEADDPSKTSIPIEAACPDALIDAHRKGEFDPKTRQLLEEEFKHLETWLNRKGGGHRPPSLDSAPKDPGTLMGLAFSGGGIRSATFALGVMQSLAARNLLRKFDYLSTVSGGGYIGASLSWWLSRASRKSQEPEFGLDANDFPYGTDDPNPKPDAPDASLKGAPEGDAPKKEDLRGHQRGALRYLRQHGNYLTPGRGLDLMAALCTVVRGVFLNVAFWFLLALTVECAVLAVGALDDTWSADGNGNGGSISLNLWIYERLTKPTCPQYESCVDPCAEIACPSPPERVLRARGGIFVLGFDALLALLLIVAVGAIVLALLYAIMTSFVHRASSALYQGRRWYEMLSGRLGKRALALGIGGSLPLVAALLGSWVKAVGIGSVLAGAASAAWTFLSSRRGSGGSIPFAWQAAVGSALLLYGGLLVPYVVACALLAPPGATDHSSFFALVGGLVVITLLYGHFVNVNYISLHRFYRDRLMEAFLPDVDRITEDDAPPAEGANKAKLAKIWSKNEPSSPYLLVNCNVVLVDTKDRTRELRGGDSFVLSPLYCGSNATGWRTTATFIGGELTLATAVAVSGAAANPNTGVGGRGPTRNRSVSLLMTAFGLGLGLWVTHPDRKVARTNRRRPTHLRPVLEAALWRRLHEDSPYLELSDGGHFENLGLYELIRRRLRLIVLCDGAADVSFSFADFQVAIRRIEEDFGARISFDASNQLECVMPSEPMGYPPNARRGKRGHLVGTIRYCDGTRGVLVYLKTTMLASLSLKTKGYKGAHPDFPDQSTADQFFDEDQFEAYRELGYRLGREMASSLCYRHRDSDVCHSLEKLVTWIEKGALNS